MEFRTRDAVEPDLDQCLALVTDRFLYDAAHLAGLRSMWSHIIESKSGLAGVVADARAASHVAYFVTSVFVTGERAERYHGLVRPGIGHSMVAEWAAGGHPFLTRSQIASANAGDGLNLVVTHFGVKEPNDMASAETLRSATYELSSKLLHGWNLRTYFNEVFAQDAKRDGKDMGEALGFRLGRYTDAQLLAAGIPRDKAPWVWMATPEDAAAGPVGMALGLLFRTFSRPRCGFTFFEQDLLKLAADGHTDESIAQVMKKSLPTTKKCFRTIYDKAEKATADSQTFAFSAPPGGVRGVETRRHLLKYLADHPEELHPYSRG